MKLDFYGAENAKKSIDSILSVISAVNAENVSKTISCANVGEQQIVIQIALANLTDGMSVKERKIEQFATIRTGEKTKGTRDTLYEVLIEKPKR